MSPHVHAFEVYGDHGPEDYGDELAVWCPGCARLRADIEAERDEVYARRSVAIRAAYGFGDWPPAARMTAQAGVPV